MMTAAGVAMTAVDLMVVMVDFDCFISVIKYSI